MTTDHISPPNKPENTTDATRGEPLAMRAQKRIIELDLALKHLPPNALRARIDLEIALTSINALLTGDADHLSHPTAADLSRLLENTKHLAETTPSVRSDAPSPILAIVDDAEPVAAQGD